MDWAQLITSIGFPSVCCLALAWYVNHTNDKHDEYVRELGKEHREETAKLNEQHTAIMLAYKDEIKDALNNNTLVMQRLCDKLDREKVISEK